MSLWPLAMSTRTAGTQSEVTVESRTSQGIKKIGMFQDIRTAGAWIDSMFDRVSNDMHSVYCSEGIHWISSGYPTQCYPPGTRRLQFKPCNLNSESALNPNWTHYSTGVEKGRFPLHHTDGHSKLIQYTRKIFAGHRVEHIAQICPNISGRAGNKAIRCQEHTL